MEPTAAACKARPVRRATVRCPCGAERKRISFVNTEACDSNSKGDRVGVGESAKAAGKRRISRGGAAQSWLGRWATRPVLIGLGWICVVLGMIGIAVPVLPTTIFLIIALWAFSKSSDRLHAWLHHHPRFGPVLRAWSEYGIIPRRAKVLAVFAMGLSWLVVTVWALDGWIGPGLLGVCLAMVAAYVWTRPERPSGRAVNRAVSK